MCDQGRPERSDDTGDDVWEEDIIDGPAERTQLDREWETRHQQFYNSGYREGLDEGKELILQCGFNAGFVEGVQAGYEFGAVRGALQTLVVMYEGPAGVKAKLEQLLQELTALPTRTVMRDTCLHLLAQEPAPTVQQQLQSALQQLNLQDDVAVSSAVAVAGTMSATPASLEAAAAYGGVDGQSAAGSSFQASSSSGSQKVDVNRQLLGLSLPQQLVAHVTMQLTALGFEVSLPPSLPTAFTSSTRSSGWELSEGVQQQQQQQQQQQGKAKEQHAEDDR